MKLVLPGEEAAFVRLSGARRWLPTTHVLNREFVSGILDVLRTVCPSQPPRKGGTHVFPDCRARLDLVAFTDDFYQLQT